MDKEKLYQGIHEIFVKYDIIGVIEKGFPEDEYQMEEANIWHYIINKTNCSAEDINNEMIKIMVEWLGNEIVYNKNGRRLNQFKTMSKEIFNLLISLK